jgi:hypothetical protein
MGTTATGSDKWICPTDMDTASGQHHGPFPWKTDKSSSIEKMNVRRHCIREGLIYYEVIGQMLQTQQSREWGGKFRILTLRGSVSGEGSDQELSFPVIS